MPPISALTERLTLSRMAEKLSRIGLFTCGLAVVATASLLAMHIR